MLSMIIPFGSPTTGAPTAGDWATFGLFPNASSFGATYLIALWLYAAGINPLRIRAKGIILERVVNWSIKFLAVMVTPIMVTHLKRRTYLFFATVDARFISFRRCKY